MSFIASPGFRPSRIHKRQSPPTCIVIHDTVSRTAAGAFRTLEAKGYATHAFVDEKDRVLWCLDPATEVGAHAGAWNTCSVGIDVVGLLDPSFLTVKPQDAGARSRIVNRVWSASRRKRMAINWTTAQTEALVKLVSGLCQKFGIPKQVPALLTSYGKKVPGLDPKTFRGVVAHAQVSTKRWDGLFGIEALVNAGFEAI